MRWVRVVTSGLVAGLMLMLGLACAVAGIMAQGGPSHPGLDVLTHFAPFWLGGAAFVTGYGLMGAAGRPRTVFIALGGIGLLGAGSLIVPELLGPISPRAAADAPHQITLIQFNVWGRNADLADTAQWIADQNADFVVIEEATPAIRDAVLRRRAYHVVCSRCQVMIFSKVPALHQGAPASEPGHPRPPIARGTYRLANSEVTILGVHYTWPTFGSEQQRQGLELARVLDHYPKASMILAGDFNSTPWSFSRRREDRMFGLERRTKALFTWPAGEVSRRRIKIPFPFLPIDHVYAGKAWRTVSVKRGPQLGSDHYPVVVTLARVS